MEELLPAQANKAVRNMVADGSCKYDVGHLPGLRRMVSTAEILKHNQEIIIGRPEAVSEPCR